MAYKKDAAQSTLYSTHIKADSVTDGKSAVAFGPNGNCAHTLSEVRPWVRVDLGAPMTVGSVDLWLRGDRNHIDCE